MEKFIKLYVMFLILFMLEAHANLYVNVGLNINHVLIKIIKESFINMHTRWELFREEQLEYDKIKNANKLNSVIPIKLYKNEDKYLIKKHYKTYYEKNKNKINERNRKYRLEHHDEIRNDAKKFYEEMKKKIKNY